MTYFTLFFFLPLIFLPGFIGERKLEKNKKLFSLVKKLKGKSKEETLKKVFNFVQKNFSSERIFLLIYLHKHFYKRVTKLINKKQFLPCHVQSLVLVTLLENTGQFTNKDFIRKTGMSIYGFIHQYYLVKIRNKTFKADPFYNILKRLQTS